MGHKINKSKILEACIQKQEELIDSYTKRIADKKEDVFSRPESASQSEHRSGGKLDILDVMEKELFFARQELAYLNTLDATSENTEVGPGAVVLTNHLAFFIGVSSEKVEADGEAVYGISTKAPIYAGMKHLKKGTTFHFNDRTYLIEDVY